MFEVATWILIYIRNTDLGVRKFAAAAQFPALESYIQTL